MCVCGGGATLFNEVQVEQVEYGGRFGSLAAYPKRVPKQRKFPPTPQVATRPMII